MNHTWIGIAHADKPGIQFDYNKFLLTSDLFLNGTLGDVSNDINIIYPPFFSSSTITSLLARNNSNRSSAIRNNDTNGISASLGKVILTFLISTMAFLTVSGNSLVIIAFIYLLIGLICIPLYAHKIISGEWHLGYILCKIWLVFDYVVGSASTLCILVISYDRYQMVSKGLNYMSKTTIRRAIKFMFGTWTIATLNYGPAILLWDWLPGSEPFQYRSCDPPFANNFPYLVTTAFVEFFVPFFSLATLNLLVYLNIRQRSRGLIRTNDKGHSSTNESKSRLPSPSVKFTSMSPENGHSEISNEKANHNDEHELVQLTAPSTPLPTTTTFSKSSSSLALARDRKAAKSLFILVFIFALCWCPYTFLTLIRALCKQPDECVSGLIYEITFWLLWFNSTINPLLYSFLHVKFRKAFYRILCFYRVRHRRRLRSH